MVRSKKSYDSPDKFVGGSPYEKIFQDQDTVIALYDIPEGARFPHINGFFSKDLADVVEDDSGWIFARGGDALIACRPLQPYAWKADRGRRAEALQSLSEERRGGAGGGASEFPTMDAFRKAIRSLPLKFDVRTTPTVRFHSLRNHDLAFTVWSGAAHRREAAGLCEVAAVRRTVSRGRGGFRAAGDEVRSSADPRLQDFDSPRFRGAVTSMRA